MECLDLTFSTPAENLACDEALLDLSDSGVIGEVLRFWESPTHFAVVGYGNQVDREVEVAACNRAGIPILRRCSGGGTVLQGPGCLNYALILRLDRDAEMESISSTNCHIMRRHRDGLRALGYPVDISGHTDLVLAGAVPLKFSGNSQRRKRSALLFHGTFLYNFDLQLLEETLKFPTMQPDYRQNRSHLEFVTNVSATALQLKTTLQESWNSVAAFKERDAVNAATATLTASKYSLPTWNAKI